METFTEAEIHALRAHAEEHWDTFRSSMIEHMSDDEFADFCHKLGIDPED